eukprot:1399990-Pyramimonas_sp.AAC.1
MDGISSGVAVLAPTYVTITSPPGIQCPVLYEGGMVAAKIAWGITAGRLNGMGQWWIVGGDWNMESTTFDGQAWLQQLGALFL